MCLERVYLTLPRVTRDIIGFAQAEPVHPSSRRVLYDMLRDFYRWIKANKDPLVPELPYVWFSRRRKKRGPEGKHGFKRLKRRSAFDFSLGPISHRFR